MIFLDLKYKGSRNYIHGSDIFDNLTDELLKIFPDSYISNLQFKKFARDQL